MTCLLRGPRPRHRRRQGMRTRQCPTRRRRAILLKATARAAAARGKIKSRNPRKGVPGTQHAALARRTSAERPARPPMLLAVCAVHRRRPPHQCSRTGLACAAGRVYKFAELAAALRRAPGVPPAMLLRLMCAAADCEDDELGTLAARADALETATAQLSTLPCDAPLPVSAAVLLCMAPDGYIIAPAQSAPLEAYGGGALAAAAQTLADEVRATFTPLLIALLTNNTAGTGGRAATGQLATSAARPVYGRRFGYRSHVPTAGRSEK